MSVNKIKPSNLDLDLDKPAKFTEKDKGPVELSEEDIKNKTEKYYANNNINTG